MIYSNWAHAALLFSFLVLPAQVQAATAFRCTGLEENKELPSIEGKDGVFFRINADLRMKHPFSDQTVSDLAELSQALAENGTTLIYVPIPTKSVVLPEYLPSEAALFGFDLAVATKVHLDILERLNAAGVATVDAREAMLGTADEVDGLPFFKADFHWSANGARHTALAIAHTLKAHPAYEQLSKTKFETTPNEIETAFSGMRRILQKHCKDTLPEAEVLTYDTAQVQSLDLGGGLDLFGTEATSVPIALVGTSFSDSPVNNFPGFIAEHSGLELVNYSMTGGNQYGAITSYLTSAEFQETRPSFLIWENPIYNNLAQFGDQPMRELIAAASGRCTVPLEAQMDATKQYLDVDLASLTSGADDTIMVDTNRATGLAATFEFYGRDGLLRTKTIVRGERLTRTGRFYMPLSGLWPDGAGTVRFSMSQPFLTQPQVYACATTNEEKS
jgi:alginate biosynthesis protein AlgX